MAERKWIPDLKPNTPLEEAARETLERRLDIIEKALVPALSPRSARSRWALIVGSEVLEERERCI